MTAEGAIAFEALEAQAASLMGQFVAAGYERVAPAFIQPAGVFLDRIGEAIRSRTYVFTDPNGEELCLRPDLTIPVARVFLERGAFPLPARLCYNGPAFRIQTGKTDPLRPREFRQAGIEYFGNASRAADVDVLRLTLDAVRSAGIKPFTIRIGHIGMLHALLEQLPMPERWRRRLMRTFWRPQAFQRELRTLSSRPAHESGEIMALSNDETSFLADLDRRGIPFIGLRPVADVLSRLKEKQDDANEPPLAPEVAKLIDTYLHIESNAAEAVDRTRLLFRTNGLDLDAPLRDVEGLLGSMQDVAGGASVIFSTGFGRHFEYYTGFVFQIEVDGAGVHGHIAGGGRYDGLISAISNGQHDVPAVGAAIHTERLLAAHGAVR